VYVIYFSFLVVRTSEIVCQERLVSEMTYYVLSGMLNSTHSLTHPWMCAHAYMTFLLLWPWPWPGDLDMWSWARYSEDVLAYKKLTFLDQRFKKLQHKQDKHRQTDNQMHYQATIMGVKRQKLVLMIRDLRHI